MILVLSLIIIMIVLNGSRYSRMDQVKFVEDGVS